MTKLDNAIRRQQAVQRRRTVTWALFCLFAPLSLLFWFEALFGVVHFRDVGLLELLTEFILALFLTFGAVQAFRAGRRFNRLLADPDRLLDESAESDFPETTSWSALLSFPFRSDQSQ